MLKVSKLLFFVLFLVSCKEAYNLKIVIPSKNEIKLSDIFAGNRFGIEGFDDTLMITSNSFIDLEGFNSNTSCVVVDTSLQDRSGMTLYCSKKKYILMWLKQHSAYNVEGVTWTKQQNNF